MLADERQFSAKSVEAARLVCGLAQRSLGCLIEVEKDVAVIRADDERRARRRPRRERRHPARPHRDVERNRRARRQLKGGSGGDRRATTIAASPHRRSRRSFARSRSPAPRRCAPNAADRRA